MPNEEIQEAEVVQEDSPSKVIGMNPSKTVAKQTFWDLLNEKHPEKIDPFNDWLAAYKDTEEWGDIYHRCNFREGILFSELPVVLQVGIWATFLNSRGEFGYDWKLTENAPTL